MEKFKPWALRMQGAKQMFYHLHQQGRLTLANGISKKEGKEVYDKAIYDWLMEDLSHIEDFLCDVPLYFTDHKKDDKGRLVSCKVSTTPPARKQAKGK